MSLRQNSQIPEHRASFESMLVGCPLYELTSLDSYNHFFALVANGSTFYKTTMQTSRRPKRLVRDNRVLQVHGNSHPTDLFNQGYVTRTDATNWNRPPAQKFLKLD